MTDQTSETTPGALDVAAVESIRTRLQASLDRDLWHPELDDVRVLLAALDEARVDLAEAYTIGHRDGSTATMKALGVPRLSPESMRVTDCIDEEFANPYATPEYETFRQEFARLAHRAEAAVAEWQEATGAELPAMARAAMRVYAKQAEAAEARAAAADRVIRRVAAAADHFDANFAHVANGQNPYRDLLATADADATEGEA